jgi:IclR family pca regulon transcriptional regulator
MFGKVGRAAMSEASTRSTRPAIASEYSQSLERGLAILSAFSESRPLLGTAELGRAVELNKSTAHRYISTLTELGYLQQDQETRKYRLGPRVVNLGFAAINSMEITKIAAPHMQALSDETGLAVSMAVLDGVDIVYIQRVRSSGAGFSGIDLNLHIGSRLPAYCTSMGKVLLAYQRPEVLKNLLDRTDLARRGPNTLTAREALIVALRRVRQIGLAVNDQELAPGLRSVAVPIRDGFGEVIAALNVAVHMSIGNASLDSTVNRLEGPLRRTATEISGRMGYREPTAVFR